MFFKKIKKFTYPLDRMSEVRNFRPGAHSFYGMMRVSVESGNPTVLGAKLYPGYVGNMFAPAHSLPLTFESDAPFSLHMTSLTSKELAPIEKKYYFPHNTEDYTQIASGILYKPSHEGADYQQELKDHIKSIISNKPTWIYIAGPKSAGKSTLSRYVTNAILSKHGHVGFLDLDMGQPELSISGVYSYTSLGKNDFLLQPPERSSKYADSIMYYGSASCAEDVDLTIESIKEMSKIMNREEFIVINSFGWVRDLGLEVQQKLLEILKPENLIVLSRVGEQVAELSSDQFTSYILPKQTLMSIPPFVHRWVRVSSYLRRGLPPVADQQPQMIPLSQVRIGFRIVDVPPSEVLSALRGSLVALCEDTRGFQRPLKKVTVLRETVPMRCHCFGVVRAVVIPPAVTSSGEIKRDSEGRPMRDRNFARWKLAIVAPMEIPTSVNTILMGEIPIPEDVLLETVDAKVEFLGIGVYNAPGASTAPLLSNNQKQETK